MLLVDTLRCDIAGCSAEVHLSGCVLSEILSIGHLHKMKADSFTVLLNPVPQDMLPTGIQRATLTLTVLVNRHSPEHCLGLAFSVSIGDEVMV